MVAEGWRFHDFRRTAVTWLAGAGFPPHVADRLLNHVGGSINGVAAIYQRGEFLAERKSALDAWATHVVAKHRAPNVISIIRAS
jgi:integrase